jgi:hypothetical protein
VTDFYVYAIFRPDGSPLYIGKGRGKRIASNSRGHNHRLQRILERTRLDGFECSRIIIRDHLAERDAFETEILVIRAIGRHPNGPLVNLTDGGEGASGRVLSESHRRRISNALLGNKNSTGNTCSSETRAKISAAQKGKPRQRHSPETRARMSAARVGNRSRLGIPNSPGLRAKISAGIKASATAAIALKRVHELNVGSTRSAEQRAAFCVAQRRRFDSEAPEKKRATNTSGFPGATFDFARQKWKAAVKRDGKSIYLGHFDSAQEASGAHVRAKRFIRDNWPCASEVIRKAVTRTSNGTPTGIIGCALDLLEEENHV